MTSKQEIGTIHIRLADDRSPRPYQLIASVPPIDTTQSINQSSNTKSTALRASIRRSPKPCTLCLATSHNSDTDPSVDPSSSQSVAHAFCIACNTWLCADHANIHSRLITRLIKRSDHKVYTVDQCLHDPTIRQVVNQSIKQSTIFPNFPCTYHQLPLEQYCSKCQTYFCLRCAIQQSTQSVDQHLCPPLVRSSHCDHGEHHLQSLHDRWNDQIKDPGVNPDIISSLKQLIIQQNKAIQSVNHNESDALANIHQAINQSVKTSVSSLLDQGIEKMNKQAHHILQTARSNLFHNRSRLTKLHQSISQIVTQLNHQTRKLSFAEIGRSIQLLDQLLKECNKVKFKPKSRRLIVQSNHTPVCHLDKQINLQARTGNPSTDGSTYGTDRTTNLYNQTLQLIFKNWMCVELVPMELAVYPAHTLTKEQEQLAQLMSIASSRLIPELVDSPNQSNHEKHSDSSNNTAIGHMDCSATHSLNPAINNSSLNHVSHIEMDLFGSDEPPALTWSNILSRIRALSLYGSLLDPAPNETIRIESDVDEFADLPTTQSICEDIRTLSFDQKLNLFQFEDVDIATLLWFMATRLTTLSTYSKTFDVSAVDPETGKLHQNASRRSDMVFDYIHFPFLSEALVNFAIFHLSDMSSLEFAHECRVRTVRLEVESKRHEDDARSLSSRIYPWRYRLNWAITLFAYDPKDLQKRRDLAPLVVEASELSELLPFLKYVSSLKALIINECLTDQQG